MRTDSDIKELIDRPTTSFLNGGGERNRVGEVVIEEEGWLFVNDGFLEKLDLSGLAGRKTARICAYIAIPDDRETSFMSAREVIGGDK